MKTMKNSPLLLALGLVALLGTSQPLFAADALDICASGQPYLWPNGGANIPFNPDQGDLGPVPAAAAVALTQQSFDNWTNTGATSATYVNAGLLPVDVDITNFGPYLNPVAPDGLSAIVFDDTGEIFNLLFGPGSGILGFAGPEWFNTVTCEVLEGVSFLNGPSFDDLTAAEDVMTHEFGHYTNLGHVELNGQLFPFAEGGDTSGPTPDNPFAFPGPLGTEVIATMYPLYFGPGSGTSTPHAEDIASIATLYPAANFFATTASISGTIFAPDGTTRLSGVNVIARNVANPMLDAVSTFSGAYTDSTSQADANVGTFVLNNLTPGAQYVLFVDQVSAQAGRFSNPILSSLPGPEEYWNGASESSDPDVDDPLQSVLVSGAAGSSTGGYDIILNGAGPGEIVLGDDDFAEIFMPFEFEICGQSFNSVFVNSNGSLTFGSGDTDFSESAGEFLSDQPRIAGLWDDLNPTQGGTISFAQTGNRFSVRYENVPEFFATGANTFEITLNRSSNHIDIDYENISATDGLAGVSCGGAVTSGFETASDLSALAPSRINLHNQPAVYEVFNFASANDLAFSTVRFTGTTNYNDNWAEPNDSLGAARNISLPFDSIDVNRFTEIEPTGGDVDFFSFNVAGNKTLVAEVLTGQLDSLLGLFDSGGNLIALDDDGGVGVLSELQVPLAAGQYFLAVTTFPDTGFTGAGNSGGRYVLDVALVDGIILNLPDDGFEEVPLGFSFPFQGTNYASVFVNSNGSLTFGSGDTDFSESVFELLNDQPRIAPLWDDLSPNNGGSVTVEFDTGSATVNFDSVPEFISTGANTFSVTLDASGSITIAYGSVTAADGIVGVTPGGGAADPGETDLSAGGSFSAVGTTYEQFTGDFDLSNQTLVFNP